MLDSKMSFSSESCNHNKVPKNPQEHERHKAFLKSSLIISLAGLKLLPYFLLYFPQSLASKAQTATKKPKLVLIAPEGISSRSPLSALSSGVSLFFFFFPSATTCTAQSPISSAAASHHPHQGRHDGRGDLYVRFN